MKHPHILIEISKCTRYHEVPKDITQPTDTSPVNKIALCLQFAATKHNNEVEARMLSKETKTVLLILLQLGAILHVCSYSDKPGFCNCC